MKELVNQYPVKAVNEMMHNLAKALEDWQKGGEGWEEHASMMIHDVLWRLEHPDKSDFDVKTEKDIG